MAAGKTTVARALAVRLGWRAEDVDELIEARERRPVAEIFARQGEQYFRTVERDILRLLLPIRHAVVATGGGTFMDVDNRAAINLDGLSVWFDVPFETVVSPHPRRRPTAAGSRPTADGTPVRRPPDGLCPGTPAARSRSCARRGDRRADPRPDSERLKGDRALSGHLRHPRQPRGTRHGPGGVAAGHLRPRAGARRPGWLRCRSQRRHRSRARAQSPVGDPRQPRQGRPAAWTMAAASIRSRGSPPRGPARRSRRTTVSTCATCLLAPSSSMTASRSAMARRSTRITTSSTATTRDAHSIPLSATCACSATPTCRWSSSMRRVISAARFPRTPCTRSRCGRYEIARERRFGRSATRRRSACGLRDVRFRLEHARAAPGAVSRRDRAAKDRRRRVAAHAGQSIGYWALRLYRLRSGSTRRARRLEGRYATAAPSALRGVSAPPDTHRPRRAIPGPNQSRSR